MPELPEVEVVRRGLAEHILGRVIERAVVLNPRASRRYEPGPDALAAHLAGLRVDAVSRRGKYLWLELSDSSAERDKPAEALVVHLGMSGQMLLHDLGSPHGKHLRAHAVLGRSGVPSVELHFVDQRTFGWWLLAPMTEVDGAAVPEPVAHIARDPLDPLFDADAVVRTLRGKRSEIKRLLLDQTVVSGVGNIYADEALWRARVHGNRPANLLTKPKLHELLEAAKTVMDEALAQGGTSFDALYVNVNGESGYFVRSLNVYGREGEACLRCGAAIRREQFMNRSSYSCPVCQPRPRAAR